ncbi:hypothetical protein LBMAG53_11930 [Planctomycetota bacterium]|nr:hypothetical protein LBMAG53_11930 [Planctomycetota bacterium]
MARISKRDEEEPGEEEIMIVPLVDVVFLLLIFFLVTASMKKPIREWDIDLPASSFAQTGKFRTDEIIITFVHDPAKKASYYNIGSNSTGSREHVSMTELKTVLEGAKKITPRPHIRLDIDRNVIMYQVAEVVDVLHSNDFRDIAFRAHDR